MGRQKELLNSEWALFLCLVVPGPGATTVTRHSLLPSGSPLSSGRDRLFNGELQYGVISTVVEKVPRHFQHHGQSGTWSRLRSGRASKGRQCRC